MIDLVPSVVTLAGSAGLLSMLSLLWSHPKIASGAGEESRMNGSHVPFIPFTYLTDRRKGGGIR